MPPLGSPGKERTTENSHKRGRSFESGLILKKKDDDLVLFNEVQNQERDNFLLHSTDDLEDSLSKLKQVTDFQLGINIPTRGERSNLLSVESEKNDYDWLLTPPETPLFPTLDDDDDDPKPVNSACRGMLKSQPIPIYKTVTDKSFQACRTGYSTQKLSPSPRSNGGLTQIRGKSSSAPHCSSPLSIQSTNPTQRSCTPANKPSIIAPRSSTPTLRRASTSSSIQALNYGGRGASPVKASRGSSASPKSQRRQIDTMFSNPHAPPSPQISLSDRSVSHVRGSSPTSRNGRDQPSKLGRKSMSPTSPKSFIPSHGQERDRIRFYKKGSMASSGDDEEYMPSITVGISRCTPPRKDGILINSQDMPFSRKPFRTPQSNSTPKRSFDSALRLMDQRKSPQSMFRPLLSSVPASTFRPHFSRNSSVTTSSNASSEHGVISVALDVVSGEFEQNDVPGEWERVEDFDSHEEVFSFDKADEIINDTNDEAIPGKLQSCDEEFIETLRKEFNSKNFQNPININGTTSNIITFESAHFAESQCDIYGHSIAEVCSKCGKEFRIVSAIENQNLCEECGKECSSFTENAVLSQMYPVTEALSEGGHLNSGVPEIDKNDSCRVKLDQNLDMKKNMNDTLECNDGASHLCNYAFNSSLKVHGSEGAGFSLLLLQSSDSTKWPIVQGKSFSATNFLCSEPSYSRNNVNALRRSLGFDGSSATSSSDLGSSRNNEELSVEKNVENNAQSLSSENGVSTHCYEPMHLRNELEVKISCSMDESSGKMVLVAEEQNNSSDRLNLNSKPSSSMPVNSDDYSSVCAEYFGMASTSESPDLNHQCIKENMCAENCASSINNDGDPENSGSNAQNIERTSDISAFSEIHEDEFMVNHNFQNVIVDSVTNSSSIGAIESHNGFVELNKDGQTECMPSDKPASLEHSNEHTKPQESENDKSICSAESAATVFENGESTILVEGPRNLTLEEATDTILFCSSIIHDIAYEAATIALEKDQEALFKRYMPPCIIEKPIPVARETQIMVNKSMPRSQKFKIKKMESQKESPLIELQNENDLIVKESTASKVEIMRKADGAKPPPKLESKCNCSVM